MSATARCSTWASLGRSVQSGWRVSRDRLEQRPRALAGELKPRARVTCPEASSCQGDGQGGQPASQDAATGPGAWSASARLSEAAVQPRSCPGRWLPPANDCCRRALISSMTSANIRVQCGSVVRPPSRHGRIWVGSRSRRTSAVWQPNSTGRFRATSSGDWLAGPDPLLSVIHTGSGRSPPRAPHRRSLLCRFSGVHSVFKA